MGNETDHLFYLGRVGHFPSNYGENKTPVTVDVLEVGWIFAFATLYFCFLLLLPAVDQKQKIYYILRVTFFLGLGLIIMAVNFGQEWEVGSIDSHMAYKAGVPDEIQGAIGMKIGLRSVNITLKALDEPHGNLTGEIIDYNERYYFEGPQGRWGFGIYAGAVQRAYRASQFKGVPYPILWVAEFFTFDGEGLRFGRNYRLAGLYAKICVWLAFPVWILTILLLKLVISYGAMMLSFLGSLLLTSSLIWAFRRNFIEMKILFADGTLETHFGVHWYLALITGVICILLGMLIKFLDYRNHEFMCKVMNINPLQYYEEYIDEEIIEPRVSPNGEVEMSDITQEKKIRRTRTLRVKGNSRQSRNFASTVVVPELPTKHYDMEQDTFKRPEKTKRNKHPRRLLAPPVHYQQNNETDEVEADAQDPNSYYYNSGYDQEPHQNTSQLEQVQEDWEDNPPLPPRRY